MPQQINLCTPILLTQKRYFSANTMAQALALIVMIGGGIAAYWVWSLKQANAGYRQSVAASTLEMTQLKAAIQSRKAVATPVDSALLQELQTRRLEAGQREKVLVELGRGLFKEGWGQSARLQLLAQSIPPEVWVTQVQADDAQLDVSGFTLEPASLNEWVLKLSKSALLQGQSLAAIKVERVSGDAAMAALSNLNRALSISNVAPGVPGSTQSVVTSTAQKPLWSFNLVSAIASPVNGPLSSPSAGSPKAQP